MEGKKVSVKFLLTKQQTGSLIGSEGRAIKELIEVTSARVLVSSTQEFYPGTSLRVVLVSGDSHAVLLAVSLIWNLIVNLEIMGKQDARTFAWSPKSAAESLGRTQDAEVECLVTIPAAAGGAVLGKGGAFIRTIIEESGARVNMSGKDEALLTLERVLTISGTGAQCTKATQLVVAKLLEDDDVIAYANRGTSYSAGPATYSNGGGVGSSSFGGSGGRTYEHGARRPSAGGAAAGEVRSSRRRSADGSRGADQQQQQAAGTDIESTISLSVPNELVGNIFGKNVSSYS
jgi:RNA-binding protein Nova